MKSRNESLLKAEPALEVSHALAPADGLGGWNLQGLMLDHTGKDLCGLPRRTRQEQGAGHAIGPVRAAH